ncbi:MAG: pyridoxal-phosphate dependent enzyme, partial [Alphaproteobacteria bacterium]
SGICGIISARDALGLKTDVIGVVSEGAPAYALSFEAGEPVSTNTADTMADGVACRTPVPAAVATINAGAARIVRVSDAEIMAAMGAYYTDCHNVAEGAGAAPLAALLKERDRMRGKRVGLVLSGGNIDRDLYMQALAAK